MRIAAGRLWRFNHVEQNTEDILADNPADALNIGRIDSFTAIHLRPVSG